MAAPILEQRPLRANLKGPRAAQRPSMRPLGGGSSGVQYHDTLSSSDAADTSSLSIAVLNAPLNVYAAEFVPAAWTNIPEDHQQLEAPTVQ